MWSFPGVYMSLNSYAPTNHLLPCGESKVSQLHRVGGGVGSCGLMICIRTHWQWFFSLQLLNFPKYQTSPLRELNFSDLCGFILKHSPKATSMESTQIYQQHLRFLLISPIEGNWITPVWRVPGFWKFWKIWVEMGIFPKEEWHLTIFETTT